jgi:precorrin-6B methylase 2
MLGSGIDTESTARDVVEVGSNTGSMSVELATTTGAIVVGIDSGSEVEMGAGS